MSQRLYLVRYKTGSYLPIRKILVSYSSRDSEQGIFKGTKIIKQIDCVI